jgi:membrane protein YdbS with pleckstrin-like domain
MAKNKQTKAFIKSKLLSITRPSQSINVPWFIFSILLFFIHPIAGGIGLLVLIFKVFDVEYWSYNFYEDFATERRGIFSVNEETVNYFRIKSVKLEEPFWMRLFGLSIIHVTTSEQFKPVIVLYGVKNGNTYIEFFHEVAKAKRKEYGIRDLDVFYN